MTASDIQQANNRESIRVCVRIRPPSSQELEKDLTFQSNASGVITVDPFKPDDQVNVVTDTIPNHSYFFGTQCITLEPGGTDRTFVVDRVFDIHASQQEVGHQPRETTDILVASHHHFQYIPFIRVPASSSVFQCIVSRLSFLTFSVLGL